MSLFSTSSDGCDVAHHQMKPNLETWVGKNGRPRPGHTSGRGPADIVVYEPEMLAVGPNEVVEDLPGGEWRRIQKADGYRAVIVNGEVTVEHDQQTETYPGRLLRHGT